jgi:Rrf2 family protein
MSHSSRFVIAAHVLALLAGGDGSAITSDRIAGSVNTNPVVIRRLLALLARAGLVTTQEGAGGGSILARPAGEIDLLTVYRAVESGKLFAGHARPPNPACPVGARIQAALSPTLDAAEAAMLGTLAGTTIADVVVRIGEGCR